MENDSKAEESNLIVALRIRPMSNEEILRRASPIAHCVDNQVVVLMDPMEDSDDVLRQNRSREKNFNYDIVFDAKSSQKFVYERTCKFLIPCVTTGYNATVFAYGATGAGKTHTMLGADEQPGIMAQALTELFSEMKTKEENAFTVSMSYLEIYNEMIRDLLNPRSGFLDLREDQNGIQVVGLSEHAAKNTDQVMSILKNGNRQRTQEPTAANQTSSRSHAVLIISIRQRSRQGQGQGQGQGVRHRYQTGKLFLIDLAGSERAANTKNRGKRMVEGAHINRSLLALGNCINALSEKSAPKYVNYRDSKLTRLLKDSLGGNSKTVMIAHISPASFHFEESRNTLIYADRAKHIKTKVHQNVVDMKMHISQYNGIIAELQDEIKRLRNKLQQQQQQQQQQDSNDYQQHRHLHPHSSDPSITNGADGNSEELNRLKNDLVTVFHEQIELRQSLTELNGSEASVCLKMTRLQILMKRHAMQNDPLMSRGRETDLEEITDKDSNPRPFDAESTSKELDQLNKERKRLDQLRQRLLSQMENTKERTNALQQKLGRLELSSEQREIVTLMARIQSLQMENARLNSGIVNQRSVLSRCDLFVSMQDRCHDISRELVRRQHDVIVNENDVMRSSRPPLDFLENAYERQALAVEALRGELLPDIRKDDRMNLLSSSGSVEDNYRLRTDTPVPTGSRTYRPRGSLATSYLTQQMSKDDLMSLKSENSLSPFIRPHRIDAFGSRGQRNDEDNNNNNGEGQRGRPKNDQTAINGRGQSDKIENPFPLTMSRLEHHNRQFSETPAAEVTEEEVEMTMAMMPPVSPSLHSARSFVTRDQPTDLRRRVLLDRGGIPPNSTKTGPNNITTTTEHDDDDHHHPSSTKTRDRLNPQSKRKKAAAVVSSERLRNSRVPLPAIGQSNNQRKLSLQPPKIYDSSSIHAPSIMSEKAAILSRLNNNNNSSSSRYHNSLSQPFSSQGQSEVNGGGGGRDGGGGGGGGDDAFSGVNGTRRKLSVVSSIRKSSLIPEPSFALHH